MENFIGFIIFVAAVCGAGFFVYTRIKARQAKEEQKRIEKAAQSTAGAAPVDQTKKL